MEFVSTMMGCFTHLPFSSFLLSSCFFSSSQVRRSVHIFFLFCLVTLAYQALPSKALLISSSKIDRCTNTGAEPPNCKRKMIVTLTVDSGQQAGAEEVVYVSTADDVSGVTGAQGDEGKGSGVERRFAPVRLTTSRSAVRYRYPLTYIQNYNAKPFEENIKGTLVHQCNADFDSKRATCGIVSDNAGNPIPYSQGFCCGCGICATLGLCRPNERATHACNLLNGFTVASCLRFGELWYSGYTIGASSVWYTLNVSFYTNATDGTATTAPLVGEKVHYGGTLHISPDHPGDRSDKYGVIVQYVGEFSPIEQPLVLSEKMLFAPSLPLSDKRVLAGPKEWMLLDKSLVSLNGRECDKVGVSYEAFASQGNMCRLQRGSCLGSQIEDYRTADLVAIVQGKRPRYMAIGFGDFDFMTFKQQQQGGDRPSPYLTYFPKSPASTMISMTISADDLQYVVSVAPGKIVSARINHVVLESMTADGVITATVLNTGAIVSRFTLSVGQCSTPAIFPIPSRVLSLTPHGEHDVTFDVTAQVVDANMTVNCTLELRNAEEEVVDTYELSWFIASMNMTNGTQGGTTPSDGGSLVDGKDHSKCGSCKSFIDVGCVLRNKCGKSIGFEVLLLAGIGAALFLLVRLRRYVFCCCKGMCSSGSPSVKKQRRYQSGNVDNNNNNNNNNNGIPAGSMYLAYGGDGNVYFSPLPSPMTVGAAAAVGNQLPQIQQLQQQNALLMQVLTATNSGGAAAVAPATPYYIVSPQQQQQPQGSMMMGMMPTTTTAWPSAQATMPAAGPAQNEGRSVGYPFGGNPAQSYGVMYGMHAPY